MGSHARRIAPSPETLARDTEFFRTHGRLPRPRLVQWIATLRCDLACPHCLAATADADLADMPLDETIDLIDQCAALGVEQVLVTGGEPLARADLPEVIAHLGRRGIPWSLNTAALPTREQRRAIEAAPPAFVAVSLDGPREVHDAFRGRCGAFDEARESIRYFAGLDGVQVAAGTTVSAFNFPTLAETFNLAVASGADTWGVHLVVPEGRAADRGDLALSRRQLGQLMRFVARKRNHFNVTMADEFGYCGEWEPLLRDGPFRCGAGLAQCVVLPDGSVVPCTTLDRTTSAGNLHERPLADLWRDGFAELRNWRPSGPCRGCRYAPGCGGGCWLMRRRAQSRPGCYRELWHAPAALKTAAGIAICLGLAAGPARAATPPAPPPPATQPETLSPQARREALSAAGSLDRLILDWQVSSQMARAGLPATGGRDWWVGAPPPALADDPAFKFLGKLKTDATPDKLAALAGEVRAASDTPVRSLAVPAMLYRAVAEWCLAHPADERTDAQRRALADLLADMQARHERLREGIFRDKFDAYLAGGREIHATWHAMTKAVRVIPVPLPLQAAQDAQVERWGGPDRIVNDLTGRLFPAPGPSRQPEGLDGWLERHRLAEDMELAVSAGEGVRVVKSDAHGRANLKPGDRIGIYDVLAVPADAGPQTIRLQSAGAPMEVVLPAGGQFTYIDLLGLTYAQNRSAEDRAVRALADAGLDLTGRPTFELRTDCLLFGAVRAARQRPAPAGQSDTDAARTQTFCALWLIDFWMF